METCDFKWGKKKVQLLALESLGRKTNKNKQNKQKYYC